MANCKYCSKEIFWVKQGRKNVPIEADGGDHKCDEMVQAFKSIKQMSRDSLSAEEIKKYEQAINKKK